MTIIINRCNEHNWLFDEFDETCPLCDAVLKERERCVAWIREWVYDDNAPLDDYIAYIEAGKEFK